MGIDAQGISSAIEKTILDTERLLGLNITLHDIGGIFHDGLGNPLLGKLRQNHHRLPICALADRNRCVEYCRKGMNAKAGSAHETYFIGTCRIGLIEIVIPLKKDNIHLATIFAGIWRKPGPPKKNGEFKYTKELLRTYSSLPVSDGGYFESVARLLLAVGQGLLKNLEEIQRIDMPHPTRKDEIQKFLILNAQRDISLADLAKRLCLSPSRTCHLVKSLFGKSFVELLTAERINRAKTFLLSTDYPVKEIAETVGIGNEYYFNRTFKKLTGLPPGKYRSSRSGHA